MISDSDLKEINPEAPVEGASSIHIQNGVPIPKVARAKIFSPEDWEHFVEEWASSLNAQYIKVRRFGGAGDLGIDIAGFINEEGLMGEWDNYQCKRYDHPLRPSDIWVEIGKVIYYSYSKKYTVPQNYFFVCSQDIGTSLEQLLNKPSELKQKASENWEKYCLDGITSTAQVPLSDQLAIYFDEFDFTIFSSKSLVELIQQHSQTHFHAVRFGGGLPARPSPTAPPETPTEIESRYIRQLLNAYGEYLGEALSTPLALEGHVVLKRDYLRQRERFYHAEALRNFARDNVPEGTFNHLQNEIYHGVIDVCEDTHPHGFARMKATVTHASSIATTSNPLSSAIKTQDRQGICHQLANDDRLKWVIDDD